MSFASFCLFRSCNVPIFGFEPLCLKQKSQTTGGGHEHHPLVLACLLGYPEVARCLVNWSASLADCWKSASPEAFRSSNRKVLGKPLVFFLEFGFGNPWVM